MQMSPLLAAVEQGQLEVVKILFEEGADTMVVDSVSNMHYSKHALSTGSYIHESFSSSCQIIGRDGCPTCSC